MDRSIIKQKTLPNHGFDAGVILQMLNQGKKNDVDWRHGKIWGLIYYGGEEHTNLLTKAYEIFHSENALGTAAFPSVTQLEAEVVSMILSVLGGDEGTVGTMTSGGTESIILSVKAHRDYFRLRKPNASALEMVVPVSAHPAFLKAAQYLDVKPVLVSVGPDYRADVKAIESACNERTIMIVSSAPSFPRGVVDPIRKIGALASSLGVGLHVDACLGGFFLPFLKKLGHDVPDFDFNIPGVTAISADLHKYGFASKGTSAILYRNAAYRRHQFFISTEWPGGLYASPTMLGTRGGGTIAAAWATLMSLGEDGYMSLVKKTMEATERIVSGISAIPGLQIIGDPDMSVFSFASGKHAIFEIADRMEQKGWRINRLNNPASLHMIVTPNHLQAIEDFLDDLKNSSEGKDISSANSASERRAIIYGGRAADMNEEDVREYLFQRLEKEYRL